MKSIFAKATDIGYFSTRLCAEDHKMSCFAKTDCATVLLAIRSAARPCSQNRVLAQKLCNCAQPSHIFANSPIYVLYCTSAFAAFASGTQRLATSIAAAQDGARA